MLSVTVFMFEASFGFKMLLNELATEKQSGNFLLEIPVFLII
jgi:hypothetical protein